MSESAEVIWERERAFAVLARQRLCPLYRMPCWVCLLLHILTGTLRSIVTNRFERFDRQRSYTWAHDPGGHFAKWCAAPGLICPHHADAIHPEYRQRSDPYWGGPTASAISGDWRIDVRGTDVPDVRT